MGAEVSSVTVENKTLGSSWSSREKSLAHLQAKNLVIALISSDPKEDADERL